MSEHEHLHRNQSADDTSSGTGTVEVMAEQLDVEVSEKVTGRVRIATRNESIKHNVEESLSSVTADVVRVPINRELGPDDPLPQTRVEGGVRIVPVLEERLVIEKRLVLVEEIHIEIRTVTEEVTVPVTLRRQQVDVERIPAEPSDSD